MNDEQLQRILTAHEWHQHWEVADGVWTPGHNSVQRLFDDCAVPADLAGKRVLDIGAWNGCCSFECERRGAAEVVALSLENPAETGFTALKEYLGSRVEYVEDSVYSLSEQTLGTFDVVLFFGVLYHLRYPLLAFDRIYNVARGDVFVETHVIDRSFPLRRGLPLAGRLLARLLASTPVWRQYGAFELHAGDQSNWFGPNVAAVVEGMASAGFACEFLRLRDDRASFRRAEGAGAGRAAGRGDLRGVRGEPAGARAGTVNSLHVVHSRRSIAKWSSL